jgi:microcompartment protein CcmK/EutM
MILGRVKGNVVSTRKSDKLVGMKLLVIQEVDCETQKETGRVLVAVDTVGAGCGELVMCTTGSPARQTKMTDARPVDAVVTGVVDYIELHGQTVFDKHKSLLLS